ncbi:prolyl oligopeptidase family-domain-containing protein [Haematococcus lacustris]
MSLLQAAARAAGPPPSVQPCPECRTNALVQPKPSCCPRQDDPFHWLRDDSHSDPKILEYLRSESQYARAVLGHSNLSALAQALRRDMAGRVPLHEAGPPWQASAALTVNEAAGAGLGHPCWHYQSRRGPGDSYWRLVRWLGPPGLPAAPQPPHLPAGPLPPNHPPADLGQGAAPVAPDHAAWPGEDLVQTVFDPNVEAAGSTYFDVGAKVVSPDGQMVAWTVDRVGAEKYTLGVQRLPPSPRRSERHTWVVPLGQLWCEGSHLAWSADSLSLYFVGVERDAEHDAPHTLQRLALRPPNTSAVELAAVEGLPRTAPPVPSGRAAASPALRVEPVHPGTLGDGPRGAGRGLAAAGAGGAALAQGLAQEGSEAEPEADWRVEVVMREGRVPAVALHTSEVDGAGDGRGRGGEAVDKSGSTQKGGGEELEEEEKQEGEQKEEKQEEEAGCELRLVDLQAPSTPASSFSAPSAPSRPSAPCEQHADIAGSAGGEGPGPWVLGLAWQSLWTVMQVQEWRGWLLLLVDTDDAPNGQLMALPCGSNSCQQEVWCCLSAQCSVLPITAPGCACVQAVVLVPGSWSCELRHMEVTPSHLAVTRSHDMITYVDVYELPAACALDCMDPGKCGEMCDLGGGMQGGVLGALPPGCWLGGEGDEEASDPTVTASSLSVAECTTEYPCVSYLGVPGQLTGQLTGQHHRVPRVQGPQQRHVLGVNGGFNPDDYTNATVWALSFDGVSVPISLSYKTSTMRHDNSNMAILHAYGAYGSRQLPSFNAMDLPLLDRGVVVAIAHVRGGGELGCAWHTRGRRQCKHNTFADLTAAARELVRRGFTSNDRLALWGRSAGGLAVGATCHAHPGLCRAVVLDVPFLDVLGAMRDPSLPLTLKERREWGDPLASKEVEQRLAGYSPYETLPQAVARAAAGKDTYGWDGYLYQGAPPGRPLLDAPSPHPSGPGWPHMLVTASLHDERVPVWGPANGTGGAGSQDTAAAIAGGGAGGQGAVLVSCLARAPMMSTVNIACTLVVDFQEWQQKEFLLHLPASRAQWIERGSTEPEVAGMPLYSWAGVLTPLLHSSLPNLDYIPYVVVG